MQLVLPDGTVLAGEKALPEILKRLKRYSSLSSFFKLPGAEGVSRSFYRWFADRRYHIADVLFPGVPMEEILDAEVAIDAGAQLAAGTRRVVGVLMAIAVFASPASNAQDHVEDDQHSTQENTTASNPVSPIRGIRRNQNRNNPPVERTRKQRFRKRFRRQHRLQAVKLILGYRRC